MTAKVVALLPNAGLANKLFVWARGFVFAQLNALPLVTIGWSYPKVGPLLRGERSSRMYAQYFNGSATWALAGLALAGVGGRIIREPACRQLDRVDGVKTYLFRDLPPWRDAFADIREYRDALRQGLLSSIRRKYSQLAEASERPQVALHVRCGDFRRLSKGEDFKKVGGVRTPQDYFLGIVFGLRAAAGVVVPITVYSDGTDDDIDFLLRLPAVARAKASNDVSDLLALSRAEIIVTSAGSTFGEWAAFLSDGIVLRHPDHIHAPIRPEAVRRLAYEGPPPLTIEEWRSALKRWRLEVLC